MLRLAPLVLLAGVLGLGLVVEVLAGGPPQVVAKLPLAALLGLVFLRAARRRGKGPSGGTS